MNNFVPLTSVAPAFPLAARTLHNLRSLGKVPWLIKGGFGSPTRRLVVDWAAARPWWALRGVDIDQLAIQRLPAPVIELLNLNPRK